MTPASTPPCPFAAQQTPPSLRGTLRQNPLAPPLKPRGGAELPKTLAAAAAAAAAVGDERLDASPATAAGARASAERVARRSPLAPRPALAAGVLLTK